MIALLKVFDLVPGWLWAAFLVIALLAAGGEAALKARYKGDAAALRTQVQALDGAIQAQKAAAATELRAVQASVLAQQRIIDAAAAAQEKTDVDHRKTSQQANSDLGAAVVAHGDRLCVPAKGPGRGGGSGGATGQGSPAANPGPADGAQAVGVLQPDAGRFLIRLVSDADLINDAYASCRAALLSTQAPVP